MPANFKATTRFFGPVSAVEAGYLEMLSGIRGYFKGRDPLGSDGHSERYHRKLFSGEGHLPVLGLGKALERVRRRSGAAMVASLVNPFLRTLGVRATALESDPIEVRQALEQYLVVSIEIGRMADELSAIHADGMITPAELRGFAYRCARVALSVEGLQHSVAAMVER